MKVNRCPYLVLHHKGSNLWPRQKPVLNWAAFLQPTSLCLRCKSSKRAKLPGLSSLPWEGASGAGSAPSSLGSTCLTFPIEGLLGVCLQAKGFPPAHMQTRRGQPMFLSPACPCVPIQGAATRHIYRHPWSAISCATTCHSTADPTAPKTSFSSHRLREK